MTKDLSTGDLNRRVTLREWSDVPNAAFGLDQTFTAGLTVWAKHEPIHGLALRSGMQTDDVATDLFYVRRMAGTAPHEITGAHVVEFAGRRYRVTDAIDVDGARRFTRITAKDLEAI